MTAVAKRLGCRLPATAKNEVLCHRVGIAIRVDQSYRSRDEVRTILTNLDNHVFHRFAQAFAGRSAHSVSMRIVPWLLVAAVAATPTPAPVALQYDEISRVIVAPATPPAPGAFADDYTLAMSARPAPVAQSSNIETPAPKSHGIVGSLSESIPGEPGGSNTGDTLGEAVAGQSAPSGSASRTSSMTNLLHAGRLIRYTFYFTKGWIREDDPVAQSATISKCDEHVVIRLNLAKRSYVQTATGGAGSDCFQMPGAPANAQPGTVDLTIDETAQPLGSKVIDGIATTGTSTNVRMTAANATGSCQNGQLGLSRITYVSNIQKPRAYCPLANAPVVATDPTQFVAQGGCKPTLHRNVAPTDVADVKLEMYLLMNTGSQPGGRRLGMLTERGHVTVLDAPSADPLFEIPAGFTAAR
jgi:hypothetical protein